MIRRLLAAPRRVATALAAGQGMVGALLVAGGVGYQFGYGWAAVAFGAFLLVDEALS